MDLEDGTYDHEATPLVVQTVNRKGQEIRLAGIQRIQKDMSTVNQLFKDLSGIVIMQGDSINAMDASVEKAVQNAQRANEEISVTEKRHRKQQGAVLRVIGVLVAFILVLFIMRTYIFRTT